jgi:hypothetical protein
MPADKEVQEELPFDKESFLQFVVVLPFSVQSAHVNEVLRFFAQLNASIELPGFGYNEVLKQLHYRYVHYSFDAKINKGWLLTVIMYVRSILELFGGWTEDLAEGRITIDQIAAQTAKLRG